MCVRVCVCVCVCVCDRTSFTVKGVGNTSPITVINPDVPVAMVSAQTQTHTHTLTHTHRDGLDSSTFCSGYSVLCAAHHVEARTLADEAALPNAWYSRASNMSLRPCVLVCCCRVCVCVCVQSAVHVINGVILPNLNATTNSTRPAGKPLWLASRARNHALASKLRAITTHKGTHSTHTGFGTLCGMAREVTGWVLARTSAPNRTK